MDHFLLPQMSFLHKFSWILLLYRYLNVLNCPVVSELCRKKNVSISLYESPLADCFNASHVEVVAWKLWRAPATAEANHTTSGWKIERSQLAILSCKHQAII
jgi:hypothetical protein